MCFECGRVFGHAPGCPNAPDPEPVYTCIICAGEIFPGAKFYDSCDGPICEECMNDMTTKQLMEMFGEEYSTASAPEQYDYS